MPRDLMALTLFNAGNPCYKSSLKISAVEVDSNDP